MTAEEFLSPVQEKKLVSAIKEAEKNTSGEIRVHLESKKTEKPSIPYVWEVFKQIGMTNTKASNGVLFYVDVNHRTLIIVADQGINAVVPDNFWQDVNQTVLKYFKKGQYAEGLAQGILLVGQKLKKYFPYQTDDINELPDEISKN